MSDKLSSVFIDRVKQYLSDFGWSQGDLAEEMGCTRSYISQLLSGHRKPGLDTLEKVALVFEVDPAELISEKVAS